MGSGVAVPSDGLAPGVCELAVGLGSGPNRVGEASVSDGARIVQATESAPTTTRTRGRRARIGGP